MFDSAEPCRGKCKRYLTSCVAVKQCFYIPVFLHYSLYFKKGRLSAQLHVYLSHAMTLGLCKCILLARRLLLGCNMLAQSLPGPSVFHVPSCEHHVQRAHAVCCPVVASELKPHIRQHCHAYEPADHSSDGPRILTAGRLFPSYGVVADKAALGRAALRAQVVAGQLREGRPVVAGRPAQRHWELCRLECHARCKLPALPLGKHASYAGQLRVSQKETMLHAE